MNFTNTFPEKARIFRAEFKEFQQNQEFGLHKNYKIDRNIEEIKIVYNGKNSIKSYQLNKIASFLSSKIKTDLAIDLDSFLGGELSIEEIAYIMATNFSVFTIKPVDLKKNPCKPFQITYVTSKINEINKEYLEIVVDSINKARYIQEMPPNLMTADIFCKEIQKNAANINNLKVTILSKKEIEKRNMGLLLGVNKASVNEPRVAILEFNNNPDSNEKIAFIGKGITFDSGGNNIKVGANMRGMKFDLSGAAVVANSLIAISKLNLKKNVVGICSLAENMVSGEAIKSDDVLTTMSGHTVEIVNTDAEGRLVLGDAVTLAVQEYKPTQIITIATLTGAIGISLGTYFTGVFCKDNSLFESFDTKAKAASEPIWRMPLIDAHKESLLTSRVADILHCPEGDRGRMGSSSTAAAFMWLFAGNTPFLHCDIAYTSHKGTNEATGSLLKTFVKYCE